MNPPWWPFRCPCGRYVGNVRWWHNDERITDVRGDCRMHGDVQLTREAWDWDLLAGDGS